MLMLNFDELVKQEVIDLNQHASPDLDPLYKVIEQSNVLKELFLGGNHLTLSNGKLANAVAYNDTIKRLLLNDNNMSIRGIKHLAHALKLNDTLQEIYLGNNNIDDDGAYYIAEMLAANKTLQWINLSGNNISDSGAKSIATSLSENMSLQFVYLDYNKIGNEGAEKIADALKNNHSIKRLDLCGNNKVSRDVMDRIKVILEDPQRKMLINDTVKRDIKIGTSELDEIFEACNQHNNIEEIDHLLRGSVVGKDKVVDHKIYQSEDKDEDIALLKEDLKNKNEQITAKASLIAVSKRQRTDQRQPKILTVQLGQEHTSCSICESKFSADTDSKDEKIQNHLPVLSSSKTCDHYFCHGCILKQQAAIAEENSGRVPKWIPCMYCKTKTAFCPSEPKYHRLLIDILKQAKWVDAPRVKEEPVD